MLRLFTLTAVAVGISTSALAQDAGALRDVVVQQISDSREHQGGWAVVPGLSARIHTNGYSLMALVHIGGVQQLPTRGIGTSLARCKFKLSVDGQDRYFSVHEFDNPDGRSLRDVSFFTVVSGLAPGAHDVHVSVLANEKVQMGSHGASRILTCIELPPASIVHTTPDLRHDLNVTVANTGRALESLQAEVDGMAREIAEIRANLADEIRNELKAELQNELREELLRDLRAEIHRQASSEERSSSGGSTE